MQPWASCMMIAFLYAKRSGTLKRADMLCRFSSVNMFGVWDKLKNHGIPYSAACYNGSER